MRSAILKIACRVCLVLVSLGFIGGKQQSRSPDGDSPPLVEISIGRHGRPILVPMDLESGERIKFLLDSGAEISAFDAKLRSPSSIPVGKTTLRTAAGDILTDLFACPPAKIGPLPFEVSGSITYLDLEFIRQATGDDVAGIVGMDFLKSHAIEIDFDLGKLRLWQTAPASWSHDTRIPIRDCGRLPGVEMTLGTATREVFILDTGANVSTIRGERFDSLAADRILRTASPRTAVTAGGSVRDKTGYLSELGLHEFRLRDTRFDRDPISALGLRHLSRFVVRIDPHSQSLYLARGQRFELPERSATSGIAVIFHDGKKMVANVEPDGPAIDLGIRPGDVLVAVDGRNVDDVDLFELAELFTAVAGRTVELDLRRGQQHFASRIVTRSRMTQSSTVPSRAVRAQTRHPTIR